MCPRDARLPVSADIHVIGLMRSPTGPVHDQAPALRSEWLTVGLERWTDQPSFRISLATASTAESGGYGVATVPGSLCAGSSC